MIDLKPFCETYETPLCLTKPFSRGDFTYAADGRVCIRVARREEVPEQENHDRPDILKLPWDVDRKYMPLITPPLPSQSVQTELCGCFDGFEHDCPDCKCVCEACNGTGHQTIDSDANISIDVLGIPFDLSLVRLIASLPNLQIALAIANWRDILIIAFTFDEGAGFLMPLSRRYKEHIAKATGSGAVS